MRAGKFGERWAELCEAYGVKPICIDVTWGQAVDPKLIAQELEKNSAIRAVFIQASETSTGVMHPIWQIVEIVKKYDNTLLIVDAHQVELVFLIFRSTNGVLMWWFPDHKNHSCCRQG